MAALDTAGWDQSVIDYYNQLLDYQRQMEAQGYWVLDPHMQTGYVDELGRYINPNIIPDLNYQIISPEFMPVQNQDYYKGYLGTDPTDFYQSIMQFDDPKYGYFGQIAASPKSQYRLIDVNNNKEVYSGTGFDALNQIKSLVPDYSKEASSQWLIQTMDPKSGQWTNTGAQKPDQSSGFLKWLLSTLPMVAIPAFAGPLGGALGVSGSMSAPVGAAVIQGASGALSGQPIDKVLMGAGLAGLGTFAGQQLGALPGNGSGGGNGLSASDPLAKAFDAAFPAITVSAPSAISGAIGGTAGGLTNIGGGPASVDPSTGELTVTANRIPGIGAGNFGTATGAALGSLSGVNGTQRLTDLAEQPAQDTSNIPEDAKAEIRVLANNNQVSEAVSKIIKFGVPFGAAGLVLKSILSQAGSGAANAAQTAANGSGLTESATGITVVGNPATFDPIAASIAGGAATAGAALSNAAQQAAQQAAKPLGPSTFDQLLAGASLINALTGSGGGNASSIPGASGRLGSNFSAKLPDPSLAVSPRTLAPRQDWTRFGMGSQTPNLPADVPQYGGPMPPGFDPDTFEWLGPQQPREMAYGGYAQGGIDGPGDGRSDSIPAALSDGEYVMDAETVALLGNGSNKAGAKKLDQFRVNIRKAKGRHLAKGQFSVKAKRPEAYLSGAK